MHGLQYSQEGFRDRPNIIPSFVSDSICVRSEQVDRRVISSYGDLQYSTSWPPYIRGIHNLLSFFIRPKLNILNKEILFIPQPYLLYLPARKEGDHQPLIEAQIPIVNRGYTRANNCRARLHFSGENKTVSHLQCVWANGSDSISLPAGLYPEILTLFNFDTITHQMLTREANTYALIPHGRYKLILSIDADGVGAREIELGNLNIPEDIISNKSFYDHWKGICGDIGYAVFLGRTLDNRLVAETIGNIPDKQLSELKGKLKGFAFEKV